MSMIQIFEEVNKQFEEESSLRDNLYQQMKKLDISLAQLQAHFAEIHQQDCDTDEKLQKICNDSQKILQEAINGFKELDSVVPNGQYYRWNGLWNIKMTNLVFIVLLRDWLLTGALSTRDQVEKTLEIDKMKTIILPVEEYLYAACNLASELSRLCINCVTRNDMKRPFLIKVFLTDLSSAFRLLNLKNDNLRKRFDGLKYDVKKVEETIYDLSIRGFKQSS
jgi:predicted translin family RNA/ssDNA-binding protein